MNATTCLLGAPEMSVLIRRVGLDPSTRNSCAYAPPSTAAPTATHPAVASIDLKTILIGTLLFKTPRARLRRLELYRSRTLSDAPTCTTLLNEIYQST